MTELSRRDQRLLDDIAAVFEEIDPVPAEVVAAAKASLTWRTVDAELAELVDDTAAAPLAGVRSTMVPRIVTFESATATVEVEVVEHGELRRLLGQVVPAAPGEVEVRWPAGRRTVEADELGRFAVEGIPAGPVSLLCRPAGAQDAPIVTAWVTI